MGLRIRSYKSVSDLIDLAKVSGSFDAKTYRNLVNQYRSAYERKGYY